MRKHRFRGDLVGYVEVFEQVVSKRVAFLRRRLAPASVATAATG
ncbi:MAG TPA: hypothetical protein VFR67_20650 [Pilimelia sp.]|nr:hypothetical protein [Pilimelia sp.]